MMNWLQWLFDSSSFVTRNHCGAWTKPMIALYQLGNALIALAYFSIPLSLFALWVKIRKIREFSVYNPWIILLFITFILLCGTTHITHVVVFWWAPYRFFALLDILTAAVSLITAIILPIASYDLIRFLILRQKLEQRKTKMVEIDK